MANSHKKEPTASGSRNQRPSTLQEFRIQEDPQDRKKRLLDLWYRLPRPPEQFKNNSHSSPSIPVSDWRRLTPEIAKNLKVIYDNELWIRCGGAKSTGWNAFESYAEAKEAGTCNVTHLIIIIIIIISSFQNYGQFSTTNLT